MYILNTKFNIWEPICLNFESYSSKYSYIKYNLFKNLQETKKVLYFSFEKYMFVSPQNTLLNGIKKSKFFFNIVFYKSGVIIDSIWNTLYMCNIHILLLYTRAPKIRRHTVAERLNGCKTLIGTREWQKNKKNWTSAIKFQNNIQDVITIKQ